MQVRKSSKQYLRQLKVQRIYTSLRVPAPLTLAIRFALFSRSVRSSRLNSKVSERKVVMPN